ncbi:hypothetical protein D3C72_2012370 [compost metagenome]
MPMPVSMTRISTPPPGLRMAVTMTLPCSVNFTALLTRLFRICSSLTTSAITGSTSEGSLTHSRRSCLRAASAAKRRVTSSTISSTRQGRNCNDICPASILLKSSTSLMM